MSKTQVPDFQTPKGTDTQPPDDFDMEECIKLGMYSIALSFGVPPHFFRRGRGTEKEANSTGVSEA